MSGHVAAHAADRATEAARREAVHQAVMDRQELAHLRRVLATVLDTFEELGRPAGVPMLRSRWVQPAQLDEWRAAVRPASPAGSDIRPHLPGYARVPVYGERTA